MYLHYFGFREYPFSITPDPGFLYLSPQHREALGHLLYGTGGHGGFVQLTGEVGTGKTTLIRTLLEQEHDNLDIALCLNPHLTVTEFIAVVCDDLGVKYPKNRKLTSKELVDRLNAHLLETHAAGRRTVLVVDEAQNLSREVLEQLRLLTNLETHKHKLVRIILVGQPELDAMLSRTDLRQLAQRITARYFLRPLRRHETRQYIQHRLEVAGASSLVFSPAALLAVHWRAHGTPRLINTICDRALMGAYSRGKKRISWPMIWRASSEVLPGTRHRRVGGWRRRFAPLVTLIVVGLLVFGGYMLWPAAPSLAGGGQASEQAQASGGRVVAADSTGGTAAIDSSATNTTTYRLPHKRVGLGRLLRLWGVFNAKSGLDCRDLHVGNLYCLQDRGSFAELAQFDRPALLILQHGRRRTQALLVGLDDKSASLLFADGGQTWPRDMLAKRWTGQFKIVWRSQTGTRVIGPGSVGNAVTWLRRRLARADGENPDAMAGRPSAIFDNDLRSRLRRFQLSNGLKPDGVVGSRTMIVLNNIKPEAGTPNLHSGGQG